MNKQMKIMSTVFLITIVWYLSFFSDENFLKLYQIASNEELDNLHSLTVEEYKLRTKLNVLAWKFKSTNFQRPALFDTLIILYAAHSILEMTGTSMILSLSIPKS